MFDFADIDCWWYNPSSSQWEQNTYSYSGTDVPSEHPQYCGDEYGHTTAESCTNKGIAWWWMMSVLAGWSSSGTGEEQSSVCSGYQITLSNPVSVPVQLSVSLEESSTLEMNLFDTSGRMVSEIFSGLLNPDDYSFILESLSSGVYLIKLNVGESYANHRMVVVN